jgi:CheY-like chemotaxis protein
MVNSDFGSALRSTARKLVLLVEDDLDALEMYEFALGAGGFDTCSARDAASAFDLACERRPDMIVTDFVLRGPQNGAELCRRLHSQPETADIPVLVVTGSTRRTDAEALVGAGCSDIRIKPYLPDALVADVARLTHKHDVPQARAS